jgi:positive regulator of sigma E activity
MNFSSSKLNVDFILTIGISISILQDRYRYLFLATEPKYAVKSDLVWLLASLITIGFGYLLIRTYMEEIYLLQFVASPALGFILLKHWSKGLTQDNNSNAIISSPTRLYVRKISIAVYVSSLTSLLITSTLSRTLNLLDLKGLRLIQTFQSPLQSVAVIFLVSYYSSRKNEKSKLESLNLTKKLALFNLAIALLILTIYQLVRISMEFQEVQFPSPGYLLIALAGTVTISSLMPMGARLRSLKLGGAILTSSLVSSGALIVCLYALNLQKSLKGILISFSLSTVLSAFLTYYFSSKKK